MTPKGGGRKAGQGAMRHYSTVRQVGHGLLNGLTLHMHSSMLSHSNIVQGAGDREILYVAIGLEGGQEALCRPLWWLLLGAAWASCDGAPPWASCD